MSPILDTVTFTPEDVYQELIKLNPSKACGPDLLPSSLPKEAAEFICVSLCKLFNQSMRTGCLPQDWVTANIVPVHKKDDKRCHLIRDLIA